jgi:hypothetical protein
MMSRRHYGGCCSVVVGRSRRCLSQPLNQPAAETERAKLIDMIDPGGACESAGTALKTLIRKRSVAFFTPHTLPTRPAFFDPSSARSGVKSMGPGIACPFEISGRAADVTN